MRSLAEVVVQEGDDEAAPLLHVHDLPQLYTKPTASSLLDTLSRLSSSPTAFSQSQAIQHVSEQGIPRYLTCIISSSLSWVSSQDDRDAIWAAASTRLAERSGRMAQPNMTRVFSITKNLQITLHEPSMTEDNLGLKTWISSMLLAKRLSALKDHLSKLKLISPDLRTRVLELGAGTGLVGIAAVCLWQADVMLTDLPEIVCNLEQNVQQNAALIARSGGSAIVRALDWSDDTDLPTGEVERFSLILAADPLYSPEHPKMLSDIVGRWLSRAREARFIVELPLRGGYRQERQELKRRLMDQGLRVEVEGEESGFDDWQGSNGELTEVRCWWSVWRRTAEGKDTT